jgi:adenylylsulfate kinase-like enzyme
MPQQRMTNIGREIADYKPDRSLADPKKTVALTTIAPGTEFQPYSQTPFFSDVSTLQGNPSGKDKDPLQHGVEDYVKQRELLFQTIPPSRIKLENVVVTQPAVNTDRVQQLIADPSTGGNKPIQVVKQGGKLYILNGHHRVAALLAAGQHPEIDAHVLDLDHPEPVKPANAGELDRYNAELHAMPTYKTVVDRLATMGSNDVEREGYTVRQHVNEGGKAKIAAGTDPEKLTTTDFTPERQQEHADIVAKAYNPAASNKEGERKVAVFLIGKPAAGKSSARKEYVDDAFPDRQFTTVNTDDLREGLSDYRGWNAAGTQAEAKIINGMLTRKVMSDNQNVVFDEVGGNTDKMEQKVRDLKELGYEVHVVHVDAPLHETINRSWVRFKESGRFVDPGYLLNAADDKATNTYNRLREMPEVESLKDIDNEGFKNKLVESITR